MTSISAISSVSLDRPMIDLSQVRLSARTAAIMMVTTPSGAMAKWMWWAT